MRSTSSSRAARPAVGWLARLTAVLAGHEGEEGRHHGVAVDGGVGLFHPVTEVGREACGFLQHAQRVRADGSAVRRPAGEGDAQPAGVGAGLLQEGAGGGALRCRGRPRPARGWRPVGPRCRAR